MGFAEFEGEEILVAKLTVGAFTVPTGAPLHKGDEVVIVLRAHVDEIAFPPGDTPVRVQKSKVVRRKIGKTLTTTFAALVDGEEKVRLLTWLEDAATDRDGGQMRIGQGDEGPNWLRPEPPGAVEMVELGDGPAKAKRVRRPSARGAAEALDEDIAEGIRSVDIEQVIDDAIGQYGGALDALAKRDGMTDEEWEASGGRPVDDS